VIRVVIADDHAVVRRGLAQLLAAEDDIEVVGLAQDGAEAHALLASAAPDVFLMDLSMPGVDGVEGTRRILADAPDAHVVVLTSSTERAQVLAALDAGASGYILKDAEPEGVAAAVRAAAAGQSPLDPRAARELLDAKGGRRPAADAGLSAREREVLELVGQGLANKQIARRLGIAERTVKAHLTAVFQAIGVTDRTQAALWVEQQRRADKG
jgi:DNA-binding NarL/FixJ family response regulator